MAMTILITIEIMFGNTVRFHSFFNVFSSDLLCDRRFGRLTGLACYTT